MTKTGKEVQSFRHSIVDIYKVSVGCCICGYNKHPSALCFDHLPEYTKHDSCKSGSKAGGMYMLYQKKYSPSILIEEIKKCRVVCSNCHMEITHKNNTRTQDNINFILSMDDLEQSLLSFENFDDQSNN
jgi:hypothetical protein